MVEFVSANPTGPLHVGHGRQGALGDALCNLFASQGWQVHREFTTTMRACRSPRWPTLTQCRLKGLEARRRRPARSRPNGDYIQDIADAFLAGATVQADDREFTASGDPDDLDGIRQFAVAICATSRIWTCRRLRRALRPLLPRVEPARTSGRVEEAVAKLVAAGKTFEAGGALWLRSTDYGDDKDRVMRKSDGGYTYFVPDVAYHVPSGSAASTRSSTCRASDHHGTIARVRAGLQAAGVGIPTGWPDYVLHKMVTVVMKGGEVKIPSAPART